MKGQKSVDFRFSLPQVLTVSPTNPMSCDKMAAFRFDGQRYLSPKVLQSMYLTYTVLKST